MSVGKLFSWILFLLLFVTGSYAMPGMQVAEDHVYCAGVSHFSSVKCDLSTATFNKHTPQKERIKIRFKSGESPVYLLAVPVVFRQVVFTDPVRFAHYNSIFFSQHHSSSSLRGPPTA